VGADSSTPALSIQSICTWTSCRERGNVHRRVAANFRDGARSGNAVPFPIRASIGMGAPHTLYAYGIASSGVASENLVLSLARRRLCWSRHLRLDTA